MTGNLQHFLERADDRIADVIITTHNGTRFAN